MRRIVVRAQDVQRRIAVGAGEHSAADLDLRLASLRDPQPVPFVQGNVDRGIGPVRGVLDLYLHPSLGEAQPHQARVACKDRSRDQQKAKDEQVS